MPLSNAASKNSITTTYFEVFIHHHNQTPNDHRRPYPFAEYTMHVTGYIFIWCNPNLKYSTSPSNTYSSISTIAIYSPPPTLIYLYFALLGYRASNGQPTPSSRHFFPTIQTLTDKALVCQQISYSARHLCRTGSRLSGTLECW
jgi:hypothetical protein